MKSWILFLDDERNLGEPWVEVSYCLCIELVVHVRTEMQMSATNRMIADPNSRQVASSKVMCARQLCVPRGHLTKGMLDTRARM